MQNKYSFHQVILTPLIIVVYPIWIVYEYFEFSLIKEDYEVIAHVALWLVITTFLVSRGIFFTLSQMSKNRQKRRKKRESEY